LAAAVVVTGLAVLVEARYAVEPVVPLRLFRDRTTSLATLASVLIGVAMFGSTVYLSLYFQRARGMSPTEAGLMSVCMVGGLLVSSIVSGRVITNTGLWKRWLVGGMVWVIAGIALLGTIDATTPLWRVGAFMAVLGLGLGATMQNLVLAVQNNTAQADMGAASSVVAFFRSMGGSIGISALGAVLAHQVAASLKDGFPALAAQARHDPAIGKELADFQAKTHGGSIPDPNSLGEHVRGLFEGAFGDATGHIFLVALPFAIGAFICVLFIREVPLRTTIDRVDEVAPAEVEATEVARR
jgi:hypothetical protein